MQKYVINSSNTNLHYCYYLPIVALIWKRIGYDPVSLILGNREEWSATEITKFIYDQTEKLSWIINIDRIAGFKDSTVSQCSRLFAAAESFSEDDYLLTSDVDLFPLNPAWWTQQDFSYGVNSFGGDWNEHQYCMMGQGATAKQWRIMMEIFENGINHEMRAVLEPSKDNWCYDELILTEQMHKYPGSIQIIDRWPGGLVRGRLDRSGWDFHGQTDLIDCHSLRPGYEHWDKLDPVFKQYCNDEDYQYIKNYTEEFNNILREDKKA